MALTQKNQENLFTSDYLKIYENKLDQHFHHFELKCENFQKTWDAAAEIFQKSFNDCDCQNAGIKDENFMRENCTKKLQEISNLIKLRDQLKNQISKQKIIEIDPQPIDIELFGLPIKRQNEILAKRVKDLEYSKHMAQKIIDELFKEVKFTEKKEVEVTIEMKNYEISIETLKAQQKVIEDEINEEVNRLKKSFVETYTKKWMYKKKYEEKDQHIRLDLMYQEKNLRESLVKNKMEMSQVKEKIEEQKIKLKEEDRFELMYGEKVEILKVQIENQLKNLATVEKEKDYFLKVIPKVEKEAIKFEQESKKKLQEIKENSLANRRINEIYIEEFGGKFESLEKTTLQEFEAKEKFIEKLKKSVCKLTNEICESNVIVEQLKADIDFFMNRDPKFVMGVDHAGGKFVHLNK